MELDYYRKALGELTEEEAQGLLQSAFEAEGWTVINNHRIDRKNEDAADLDCRKEKERRLVAVKIRPEKQDTPQLTKLVQRSSEGHLLYAYFDEPTPLFRKEIDKQRQVITFLGPRDLHDLFLQDEVIDYLTHYFSVLPVVNELAETITTIWESRNVVPPKTLEEGVGLGSLWELKDSVLKTRSAIGMIATRWEADLNQRTEIEKSSFDFVLNEIVRDLDLVQNFTGGSLINTVKTMQQRTPYILSIIWSVIRPRTNWIEFTHLAEECNNRYQVYELARRYWVVPSSHTPFRRTKSTRANMRFFYSGLIGILRNIACVATDLDYGIDWAWGRTAKDSE